jgi:hypothetical protein
VSRCGCWAASAGEAAEIHWVTEGNPFFVTEVLAAGGVAVPPTVRDAVLARLGRPSAPMRSLLKRLSVIPTRAERWLAETLAHGDPGVLLEAERTSMIIGGAASVSFRHELARQAIESSLIAGERLPAKRAVIDALLGQPGVEPSRLVHHAEHSGQIDVILEHGPPAGGGQQSVQDSPADGTGQAGGAGGEDSAGGGELVAGGLHGGGEAGPVGVRCRGRVSTTVTMAIRRNW